MPTKIETSLSAEELMEFMRRCAQSKGGMTGPAIQALAAEWGVTISHQSANTFRKGKLQDFLEELKETKDFADNVAALAQNGVGLSDGAASVFAGKVFKAAVALKEEAVGGKVGNNLSLAIARLRSGDQRQRMVELLQQKLELQQFDAASAAIAHAKEIRAVVGDKSIDDTERVERVRKILFGERPADWKPVTDTGADAGGEGEGK